MMVYMYGSFRRNHRPPNGGSPSIPSHIHSHFNTHIYPHRLAPTLAVARRHHERGLQEDSVQVDSGLPLDATPAPTPPGPSIVLSNPLQGEVLFNGAVALVRWVASLELATVNLTLSDGTVVASGLDAATANGTYYWAVKAAPAMAHSLHIRGHPLDAQAPVLEDESGQFAIQDETTVVVTAPARNLVVLRGEAVSITWRTKGGTVTDVGLAVVSAANISKVLYDFGLQPNSGEFVWVPGAGIPLGRYAVRLVYSPPSAASLTVVGPAFRLKDPAQEGAIAFLSPKPEGGEKLASGATYVYVMPLGGVSQPLFLGLTLPSTTTHMPPPPQRPLELPALPDRRLPLPPPARHGAEHHALRRRRRQPLRLDRRRRRGRDHHHLPGRGVPATTDGRLALGGHCPERDVGAL